MNKFCATEYKPEREGESSGDAEKVITLTANFALSENEFRGVNHLNAIKREQLLSKRETFLTANLEQ